MDQTHKFMNELIDLIVEDKEYSLAYRFYIYEEFLTEEQKNKLEPLALAYKLMMNLE